MNKNLIGKIKKIKVLVMDVDGVLTSGQIILDQKGNEVKVFDVKDGFAIVLFHRAGYKTAIISARSAAAVSARAKDLKIDKVYQDAYPKIDAYHQLLKEFKVTSDEVCFIGDDLPDVGVLKNVGLAVAVSDAVEEVKNVVHYVTKKEGGSGAVRETIELILKTKGEWDKVLAERNLI